MSVRILHCHSTFALGGKEARAARLMNAFGRHARHVVLSGMPGQIGARRAVDADIDVTYAEDAPPLHGRPSISRYRALADYMSRFDLVLTYNWGALDMVMTRRVYARHLPPLVHHEDGFNADEAFRLKTERNLFRRVALPAAHALAVPSRTLAHIARQVWKQPAQRIHAIPNGIRIGRFGPTATVAIPGLKRQRDQLVIGTVAGLRPVKNLSRLVRATQAIPNARLVIIGDGPDREAILETARTWHMADRLVMPGFMPDPSRYMGHFDIFALSSDSEQAPIALIEAMATGLPIISPDVGDVIHMVAPENHGLITPRGDEAALGQALARLAGDRELRRTLGRANRAKAEAVFDEGAMINAYRALYEGALRQPGALGGSTP